MPARRLLSSLAAAPRRASRAGGIGARGRWRLTLNTPAPRLRGKAPRPRAQRYSTPVTVNVNNNDSLATVPRETDSRYVANPVERKKNIQFDLLILPLQSKLETVQDRVLPAARLVSRRVSWH